MSDAGHETEAKFYVLDLRKVQNRLQSMGAGVIEPRLLERNIRFDLPGHRLRAEGRVLRIRSDRGARLTYKGPSTNLDGVLSRVEIEFEVGDFGKARELLEVLGYEKMLYYEKFRTVFTLGRTYVMLDELPYGDFVEIEGDSVDSIREVCDRLEFNWATAVGTSYNALFDRVRRALRLNMHDLSFGAFEGIKVTPADLGVRPADEPV